MPNSVHLKNAAQTANSSMKISPSLNKNLIYLFKLQLKGFLCWIETGWFEKDLEYNSEQSFQSTYLWVNFACQQSSDSNWPRMQSFLNVVKMSSVESFPSLKPEKNVSAKIKQANKLRKAPIIMHVFDEYLCQLLPCPFTPGSNLAATVPVSSTQKYCTKYAFEPARTTSIHKELYLSKENE